MKRLTFLVALSVFLCMSSVSATAADGWTASMDLRSKYIGGMNGAQIVNKPVIQPGLMLNRENCFAGFWASLHWDNPSNFRSGDEVDLIGGCVWIWGFIKHTVAILFYDFYPLSNSHGDPFLVRDTMAFSQIAGWTPTLAIETVVFQNNKAFPGIYRYKAEVSREMILEGNRFITNVAFGGHDGTPGLKPEAIGFVRGGIAYPIRVGSTTVAPSLMLQRGKGGIAQNEVVLGVSINF